MKITDLAYSIAKTFVYGDEGLAIQRYVGLGLSPNLMYQAASLVCLYITYLNKRITRDEAAAEQKKILETRLDI